MKRLLHGLLGVLAFVALHATNASAQNLLSDPGFEMGVVPHCDQAVVPNTWFISTVTPDVYSFNCSTLPGLAPPSFNNFPGLAAAYDGLRFVAGGHFGSFIEAFGQTLGTPLIPGRTYRLSGFFTLSHQHPQPGVFDVYLSETTSWSSATFLGSIGAGMNQDFWSPAVLSFAAPANATGLPNIIMVPRSLAASPASYMGTDAWSLRLDSEPPPISCGSIANSQWLPGGVPIATGIPHEEPRDIVSDGSGGVIVIWSSSNCVDPESCGVFATRVTCDGLISPGWGMPHVPLQTPNASASEFLVAISDGSGGVFTAWNVLGAIHVQRVTAAGEIAPGWPDSAYRIGGEVENHALSFLVPDSTGGVIVVWTTDSSIYGPGLALRLTGDGQVASGWPPEGVAPDSTGTHPGGLDAGQAMAVADGQGGAIMAWPSTEPGVVGPVAQHLDASGARVSGWPPSGIMFAPLAFSWMGPLTGVPDGSGGAIIVWWDARDRTPELPHAWGFYALRMTYGGEVATGWPSGGLPIHSELNGPPNPGPFKAVADGAGGAYVEWKTDVVPNRSELHVTRVSGAGTFAPGWDSSGLLVTPGVDGYDYGTVDLQPDGQGGLYVAWTKSAWSIPDSVYLLRLDPGGSVHPGWNPPLLVRPMARTPFVVATGSGDAIVAWTDLRNWGATGADLYANRFCADGSPVVSADNLPPALRGLALDLPGPTPSRGNIRIDYAVPNAGHVNLRVYDVAGRRVATLVDREHEAGRFSAGWKSRDDAGVVVRSGVYFVSLQAGADHRVRRVLLVR